MFANREPVNLVTDFNTLQTHAIIFYLHWDDVPSKFQFPAQSDVANAVDSVYSPNIVTNILIRRHNRIEQSAPHIENVPIRKSYY